MVFPAAVSCALIAVVRPIAKRQRTEPPPTGHGRGRPEGQAGRRRRAEVDGGSGRIKLAGEIWSAPRPRRRRDVRTGTARSTWSTSRGPPPSSSDPNSHATRVVLTNSTSKIA
ncbi:NfeD family protein [Streptomyces sp. KL116D]|uniref:NfeD family protein n=1 Tax=Streptomyces sp. KL116D TaxID=3045152 RepID=UPI003557A489